MESAWLDTAKQVARTYGVWIIVGAMVLEIILEWRRNQRATVA